LNPQLAFTYNNRGEAYRLLNMYAEAIADFDRALHLDSSLATVYYNRGLAYSSIEQPHQALMDYNRALELDPTLHSVYQDRAGVYAHLKRHREAIADYNRILAAAVGDVDALLSRGIQYIALNEFERAMQDFNAVIELHEDFSCAYSYRGEVHLRLYNLEQARADCARSWQLDATHLEHGWMTQWIDMCIDEPDIDMAQRLEAIAAREPENYTAYLCRGTAYWLRDDTEQALEEFRYAISMVRERWDAYFWKAMACISLRRDYEARTALEQALDAHMPPALLAPLRLHRQHRPDFYMEYALPLLERYAPTLRE
jgi:tetratricopeptide (TPR) repeat protein